VSFLLIVWPFLIPIGAAFYMFYLCWTRCVGGLKARSVTKYVEYVKQVVKSMKAERRASSQTDLGRRDNGFAGRQIPGAKATRAQSQCCFAAYRGQ
jgi:hypothetical protein